MTMKRRKREFDEPGFGQGQASRRRPDPAPAGGEPETATDEVYKEALRTMQLQAQENLEKIRSLELQVARAPQPRSKASRKASAKHSAVAESASGTAAVEQVAEPPHPLASLVSIIRGAGRKYSILHKPWPPGEEVWQLALPRPRVDPLDASTRYPANCSDEEKALALTRACAAELHDFMPEAIRPHITNQYLISQVRVTKPIDQKSKAMTAARAGRLEIFSHLADVGKLTPIVMIKSKTQRKAIEDDPNCQYWRGNLNDLYPPIVFPHAPPESQAKDRRYLFKSLAIAKFIRLMLFGSSSLSQEQPMESSLGRGWQLRKLTYGMVAFAAIGVQYLLSHDQNFEPVGATTQTKYAYLFSQYMSILVEYGRAPRMKLVLSWLEAEVFRGVNNLVPSHADAVAPGVHTQADPRDLAILASDLSVELDEPPILDPPPRPFVPMELPVQQIRGSSATDFSHDRAAPFLPHAQATASRIDAPAPPNRVTTSIQAVYALGQGAPADVRTVEPTVITSSGVSYATGEVDSLPQPAARPTSSGNRIRPRPLTATSASHSAVSAGHDDLTTNSHVPIRPPHASAQDRHATLTVEGVTQHAPREGYHHPIVIPPPPAARPDHRATAESLAAQLQDVSLARIEIGNQGILPHLELTPADAPAPVHLAQLGTVPAQSTAKRGGRRGGGSGGTRGRGRSGKNASRAQLEGSGNMQAELAGAAAAATEATAPGPSATGRATRSRSRAT
ncbi:hypothetical protein BV20DRAFT_978518 [Pilatotrama ljubarskyi]|nr:hypothetical protein BV20DRAFT_978518 [Pilatotrama ljubarskyi]